MRDGQTLTLVPALGVAVRNRQTVNHEVARIDVDYALIDDVVGGRERNSNDVVGETVDRNALGDVEFAIEVNRTAA